MWQPFSLFALGNGHSYTKQCNRQSLAVYCIPATSRSILCVQHRLRRRRLVRRDFLVEALHKLLEEHGLWDQTRRLELVSTTEVAIPVVDDALDVLGSSSDLTCVLKEISFRLERVALQPSRKSLRQSPAQKLSACLESFVATLPNCDWSMDLEQDLPHKWERHGDLVLLPETCFQNEIWNSFGPDLWATVCSSLDARRLAKRSAVADDKFRSSQVRLLTGDCGWVTHVDNGIQYSFDVTRCMFSSGNITEKLRVASMDCRGETVVDMFAGIGYFTLPYLVHAGADLVYACEWNPDAVEALERNLTSNKVGRRCVVLHGDNRQVCPVGVADRVNLGLIPSSEASWEAACRSLKPRAGGMLHIHGNVTQDIVPEGMETCCHGNLHIKESDSSRKGSVENCKLHSASMDNRHGNSDCCYGNTHTHKQIGLLQGDAVTDKDREISSAKLTVEKDTHKAKNHKYPKITKCNKAWTMWAESTALRIRALLNTIHSEHWNTTVVHIEHVKSYAPRVDHLVLDLECRPLLYFQNKDVV